VTIKRTKAMILCPLVVVVVVIVVIVVWSIAILPGMMDFYTVAPSNSWEAKEGRWLAELS
jgi:hypothetical protein